MISSQSTKKKFSEKRCQQDRKKIILFKQHIRQLDIKLPHSIKTNNHITREHDIVRDTSL